MAERDLEQPQSVWGSKQMHRFSFPDRKANSLLLQSWDIVVQLLEGRYLYSMSDDLSYKARKGDPFHEPEGQTISRAMQ